MSLSKKGWLAGIGLLALVSLVVGCIIWPNYRQAAAVRGQITSLYFRVASFGEQTNEVKELEAQLAEAQHRIANEFKLIPDDPDSATLIGKLSQDVDRVRVLDQTFQMGSPSDAIIGVSDQRQPSGSAAAISVPQASPLNVDMEATFDSVFALIQNAESVNRLVRVASVRVLCKRSLAPDEKDKLVLSNSRGADPTIVKASVVLEAIFNVAEPKERSR